MLTMNATKKDTLLFVKTKLATDPVWAVKALVRIYQENQTADEQVSQTTTHDNGIGFSGADAEFLSSLAQAQLKYGRLTDKQLGFVLKKMPKYARQVIAFSDAAKLATLVTATKAVAV
jgi:hypothetical protein